MAIMRIPEQIWETTHHHLFGTPGEHFAFLTARWTYSRGKPVFMVHDVLLIPDAQVTASWNGMELSLEGILNVINTAVESGDCLIEAHNHGGVLPRFSPTDRKGFEEFPRYLHESLPGRPYAATVWGDSTVYGEYFLPDEHTGRIEGITVIGKQLRSIVSRDDDGNEIEPTFDRQLPWFNPEGQRQLARLRVAVVGCGGTGSHVIQNLAYLGCRDFVLIDDKQAGETNMNRLVTAAAADIETPKVILGRRLIKSIAPTARVFTIEAQIQSSVALDTLKGVDVIFGCVDNDGARLILNELALAFNIPYFDLAVGIEAQAGSVTLAGGRVAVVLPGGPCLHCMGEIDPEEAAYFLASPTERAERIARGYVTGIDVNAPAVVSLNALIASAAINEFVVLVSGIRDVTPYTEYDQLGISRSTKSQWLVPTDVGTDPSCVQCAVASLGDTTGIERYIRGADK